MFTNLFLITMAVWSFFQRDVFGVALAMWLLYERRPQTTATEHA
jgi:hypothetical protein